MKDTRTVLIALGVVALFGILILLATKEANEPRTIGQAIDEGVEEVVDEIDDNT